MSSRPSGLPYPDEPPRRREDLGALPGRPGTMASVGLRTLARVVDFVVVFYFPYAVLLTICARPGSNSRGTLSGPVWLLTALPLAYVLYEAITVTRSGQTLGKFVVGVTVVDWKTGSLPSWSHATLRALIVGLGFYFWVPPLMSLTGADLLTVTPVVVPLTAFLDALRRGWHDKAASTLVVSSPRTGRRID